MKPNVDLLIQIPYNLPKETGQDISYSKGYDPAFFSTPHIMIAPIKETHRHNLIVFYKPEKKGIIPITQQATCIEYAESSRNKILTEKRPIMVSFIGWENGMPVFSRRKIRIEGQTFIRQKLLLDNPQVFWACLVSKPQLPTQYFTVEIGYGIRAIMTKRDFSSVGFDSLENFLAYYGFTPSRFPVVLSATKSGKYYASFVKAFKQS